MLLMAFLDHGQRDFGYAVFGKVVRMDVADKISKVKRERRPVSNVPVEPSTIISLEVIKKPLVIKKQ